MTAFHPITIVGGGLAGLTLGVALRQRDVPVTLYEAGSYPRHRVCGEFICGRGIDVLHTLGLYPKFVAAGAVEARSAAFCEEARRFRQGQAGGHESRLPSPFHPRNLAR